MTFAQRLAIPSLKIKIFLSARSSKPTRVGHVTPYIVKVNKNYPYLKFHNRSLRLAATIALDVQRDEVQQAPRSLRSINHGNRLDYAILYR